MLVRIHNKELLAALNRCKSIVFAGYAGQEAINALIVADENNMIRVSSGSTNMSVTVTAAADVRVPGRVAVPVNLLHRLVKTFSNGWVSLTYNGGSVAGIQPEASTTSHAVPAADGSDFPPLPEREVGDSQINICVDDLLWLIKRTEFAISTDDRYPAMQSALLESDEHIVRMVGCSRHRLAKAEVSCPSLHGVMSMVIPQSAIRSLGKTAREFASKKSKRSSTKQVLIERSESHVFFTFDATQFSSRLRTAKYPDYSKAIPDNFPIAVHVPDRQGLLETIKRLATITPRHLCTIVLKLCNNKLRISTTGVHRDEFAEIDADCGDVDFTVAVDGQYVVDVLKCLDSSEGVVFRFTDPLEQPIRVEADRESDGKSWLYVVMPARLY